MDDLAIEDLRTLEDIVDQIKVKCIAARHQKAGGMSMYLSVEDYRKTDLMFKGRAQLAKEILDIMGVNDARLETGM